MSTKLEIMNLALSHLGVKNIASVTAENEQARKCVQFYEVAKQETLKAHTWNFATKISTLALISDEETPGWEFVYQRPSNCLFIRKLITEEGEVDPDNPEKFKEIIASGNLQGIATNLEDAYMEYTFDVVDTTFFGPTFVKALSYKLAMEMAVSLTGKSDLVTAMGNFFNYHIAEAERLDSTEGDIIETQESQFEKDRA